MKPPSVRLRDDLKRAALDVRTIPFSNVQNSSPFWHAKVGPIDVVPLPDVGCVVPNEATDLQVNPIEDRRGDATMRKGVKEDGHERMVDET